MLTTTNAIRDEIGDGNDISDAVIRRKIRVYSDLFQTLCKRDLVFGDHTEKIEMPSRRRRLVVSVTPVVDVHEIRVNKNPIPDDEWKVEDSESGFIKKAEGSWASTGLNANNITRNPTMDAVALYEVDYEAGYVTPDQAEKGMQDRTLPYDIEDAVIAAVIAGLSQKGMDSGIAQISVGDASTRWSSETFSGMGRQVPSFFEKVAERYAGVKIL